MHIDAKWTDSDGNIWYKTHGEVTSGVCKGYTCQELDKVSRFGTVWEGEFTSTGMDAKPDPDRYPKEFHTGAWAHGIMYRYRLEE
jgi:hypothetical protein